MRQPATTTGRKRGPPNRKTKQKIEASDTTPLDFLLMTMRNRKSPRAVRLDAAKAALPYIHPEVAPLSLDVMRLLGQLLVKFDAGPEKR